MNIIEELLKDKDNSIYDITKLNNKELFIRVRNKEDWNKVIKYIYSRLDIKIRLHEEYYEEYKEESCIYLFQTETGRYKTCSCWYDYYVDYYRDMITIEVNQLKDWEE